MKNELRLFEGLDVTEMLNIIKYDPPIPAELAGKVKGNFPSFIRKTDEERIQNLAKYYEKYKDLKMYVTEKLDGSSATYFVRDGVFGVCSRNLELSEPEEFVEGLVMGPDGIERPRQQNTFWKIAVELGLKEKMLSLGKNICIQGEIYGNGIQGNPYCIKGHEFRIYNIFDIDSQEYFNISILLETAERLKIPTVPIIEMDFKLPSTIEDLLLYSEGKSILNPGTEREGIVIRSYDRKISFKVISNKFLLGEK